MTTLCRDDIATPRAGLISGDFHPPQELRDKVRAGALAFQRAILQGYSRISAQAFMRTAKREHIPGTEPEATARRIVPAKSCSAMVLPPRTWA